MLSKFILAASLAGFATLAPTMASAQTSGSSAAAPAEKAPPTVELYGAADASAVLNARLAALKTVIGLNPDQSKLWDPVEAAIRKIAKQTADRRAERAKVPHPASFVDILERTADAEVTRGQEMKEIAAALKPLVASLTPEQQRRIPAFLGMRERTNGMPQPTAELWFFEEEQ